MKPANINSEAWTALHQGIEYALLQETCASSSRPISGFLVWHLASLQAILLQGLALWGRFDFVCGESVPCIRSRSVFLLRRLGRLSGLVFRGTFDIALVQNGKDGRLDRLPMGLVGGIAHDGQGEPRTRSNEVEMASLQTAAAGSAIPWKGPGVCPSGGLGRMKSEPANVLNLLAGSRTAAEQSEPPSPR